jgi:hypothetical protein
MGEHIHYGVVLFSLGFALQNASHPISLENFLFRCLESTHWSRRIYHAGAEIGARYRRG